MQKAIEYIPLSDLEFDADNPRIPKKIPRDDVSIIEWMLKEASLIDLMESISSNGFFQGEPLLVTKSGDKFIVIEGNRRLASCKLLNGSVKTEFMKTSVKEVIKDTIATNIPTTLPVVQFNKKAEVLNYLGYKHVSGVKSWGSLAKAKYLFELYQLEGAPNDRTFFTLLARRIGSKADYVRKLIVSYRIYLEIEKRAFFKIANLDDNSFEFSKLSDATTRYSKISSFLQIDLNDEHPTESLNLKNLEKLTKWLFEKNAENQTRIGDNRNIRILNEVVGNSRALTAFESGKSLKEASQLTSYPNQILQLSLQQSLGNLKIAYEILPEVKETEQSELTIVKEVLEYLKILNTGIKEKLSNKENDEFQL